MTIYQAPPGTTIGAQIKLLSGSTYTVDAENNINVTSQADAIASQLLGFYARQPGGYNNLAAAVDPTSGSDTTLDYQPGSIWLNTTASPARAWICLSNATGAAVWMQISVGTLIATAGSAQFINLVLTGLLTESANAAVTAFSGGGQSSATSLTNIINNVTTSVASSAPFDSVKFSGATIGMEQVVFNNSTNPIQLFGTGSVTINGFASGTGVTLPVGTFYAGRVIATNTIQGSLVGMGFTTNVAYNTNTATATTTLTGANISGGINEVTLNLTGTLGGAANAQLPTVANLLAAIYNPVSGYSYKVRIINSSGANFAWTVTTNTGFSTLLGTQSIAQNTWRDFYLTITSVGSATATWQSIGVGTQS